MSSTTHGRPESKRARAQQAAADGGVRLERALAERDDALRAKEKLERLLDRITDGTLVLDRAWRYTLVSARAGNILGMSPEDLLGRCVWELFPSALGTRFDREYHRAMETGQPTHFEEYYPAPLDKWFECHCFPSADELTVFFRDVTDHRRAAAALRESTDLLRAVSDASPDAIFVKDRVGRMRFANPATLALIGKPSEQVLGRTDAEFLQDPEVAARVMDNDRHVRETGEPEEVEEFVPRRDGTPRIWLSRKMPYRDANGAIVGILGISRDITERKLVEEELRASDRQKSEFLAVLSHELRNPLAPIRNSLYLLERAAPGSAQAERALDTARRQTDHLTRLVDDLLDLTRISRGNVLLRPARIDLRDIVRKTTEDLSAEFARAGVQLQVAEVPNPVWIHADATRMTQVLGNLLHNAVKFTPSGGSVAVLLETGEDTVELRVRDTGVGMEPGTVPQMFEPFVQGAHTLARSRGGLGLGLAVIKGLLERSGGSIEAYSAGRGRGSEFCVRMPLSSSPEPAQPAAGSNVGSARRVLIVEDNVEAAQSLADLLEIEGHVVSMCHTGGAAVEGARRLAPNVVLCDVGLPDMDGYAVARALRSAMPGARLVALSGYAQPEDRQRALLAGFDAHLPKPPDLVELLALIRETPDSEGRPMRARLASA